MRYLTGLLAVVLMQTLAFQAASAEDCQVCCQPIDLAGEVDESGKRVGVAAERP